MKYFAFIVLLAAAGLPLLAFGQTQSTSTEFIPLTNIPFLTETGNAFSLDSFLNGLFRLSIGAAAVIAVLQIMRAGIMYMGSDSGFAEKKEAKNLIALSIGGLILVLSPVVVFSIINPEILSLKIGNIEGLSVPIEPTGSSTVPIPGAGAAACRVTYLETALSMDCSAAGPDWEEASPVCCSAFPGAGVCCGRTKSTPPPDSTDSWSYTIAVRSQTLTFPSGSCIRYEQGTDSDVTACALKSINRTNELSAQGTEYVVTSECNGTTRSVAGTPLNGLPTCAQ